MDENTANSAPHSTAGLDCSDTAGHKQRMSQGVAVVRPQFTLGSTLPPTLIDRRQWLTGTASVLLAGSSLLPAQEKSAVTSAGVYAFDDRLKQQHKILARVLVEKDDGELLLQGVDGRIWQVPPDRLLAKSAAPQPFAPLTGTDLGRELVQQFKTGFQSFVAEHYVICTNASDAYAEWCSELLERLVTGFRAYWKQRGLQTSSPSFPLVALVFQRQTQFAEFATTDVGPDLAAVPGYYSIPSNRIVLRDLTEASKGQVLRTLEEVRQRMESAQYNVATMIHEATHQIAFNCGLHTRLADNPLWLTEGMAVFFETPDLRSKTGWKTAGQLNRPRLQRFKEFAARRRAEDSLATLIGNDERLTKGDTAEDAYAESWALSYFLIRRQTANYVKYIQRISAKLPLAPATTEQRMTEFQDAFGNLKHLDADFLRYAKSLR